jgi:hypothetical protein
MKLALVVVRPFAAHGNGDLITDPTEIARVLGSEHAACVVKVVPPGGTSDVKEG